MKKFTKKSAAAIVSVLLAAQTAVSAQMMYAPDGRSEDVPDTDVYAWENVGWYQRPVTRVYAPDGSSSVIYSSDVDDAVKNGWYQQPVVYVYAPDGSSSLVYKSDVAALKSKGWYSEPVTTIYAPDGRSSVVYKKDVQSWVNVGWFTSKAAADKAKSKIDYSKYVGRWADTVDGEFPACIGFTIHSIDSNGMDIELYRLRGKEITQIIDSMSFVDEKTIIAYGRGGFLPYGHGLSPARYKFVFEGDKIIYYYDDNLENGIVMYKQK
ncbi:MAG: hypothetical protein PUF72_11030 [Clostridiales bacterium]|nr:hypothetical protein [Clostridiales bacterium]